jgi:hypothetical protein
MPDETYFQRTLRDVTKNATPGHYRPDTMIGDPNVPRQPAAGSVEGLAFANNVMRPVDLMQKPGQDFGRRATSWERDWSILANGPSQFRSHREQ